jgi:predicted MFS family arabinose efflux permease
MSKPSGAQAPPSTLAPYQKLVVALLAFLQFTVVLDFMILAPMGPIVMHDLHITPSQFGLVVSAYAFSAGISGLLSGGFADRFDRKRYLLFFFAGFLIGTFLCGIAPTYPTLLAARVVAGLFGGVIGSTSFAIVTDLFPMNVRGRVMGTIQTAFSASQVMGVPVGLFLAGRFGWNGPFRLIAALGTVVALLVAWKLRPITTHLEHAHDRHPLVHLWKTATQRRYMVGFAATMLVATGGFMLQPFASHFAFHNLGVAIDKLPALYMGAGLTGLAIGPLAGRLADRVGKFRVLFVASVICAALIWWWTGLGMVPFWLAVAGNCALFATITSRQVTTMALISGVPHPRDRGAYMAVSSSLQQFSGAVASSAAGLLVVVDTTGRIANYHTLGWVVIAAMALTVAQLWNVNRMVLGSTAH